SLRVGEVRDVVARLGLRFGSQRQQQLVALTGDVVDLDVDLLAIGPFLDDGGLHIIGAGHPMVPHPDAQAPGSMSTPYERRTYQTGGDASGHDSTTRQFVGWHDIRPP